jgi:hypothetical protein
MGRRKNLPNTLFKEVIIMAWNHFRKGKLAGALGLWVGDVGSEVQVAGPTGQLHQNGTAIKTTAAELDRGALKKVTGALAAVDTGGGVFSWKNPEASDILVEHVALVVTTKTTDACTVDVGTTATNATTSSDTLIDGANVATAGTYTNDESAGTNGKPFKRLAAGKWVTGSVASGASAGIKGTYEIYYRVL